MRQRKFGQRQFFLWVSLALIGTPRIVFAQAKPEEIRFDTVDKVEIKGTFYPGGANKAPCVLLLHELGGDRQKGGWDDLAKALQAKGFAVLSFDFRGHNDSTNVEANVFWSVPINNAFRFNKDGKISYTDLAKNKSYVPMLVNDIAAAKRYLDQRNDANDCNSSNLTVIGAKEGAALGSLWICTEWNRHRFVMKPDLRSPLFPPIPTPTGKTEGEDIASAVWLSIPEKLMGQSPVSNWLRMPAVCEKVPMAFFYGDKDDASSKTAKNLVKLMKTGTKKLETTTTREKKDTKSAGSELLGKKGLNTEEDICTYLEKVMEKRGNVVWVKKDPPMNMNWVHLKTYGFASPY